MRSPRLLLAPLFLSCLLPAAQAQTGPPESSARTRRPVVGLVLSGGGARGAAHVGVLEVLEELRVPVDLVAGTSMGSIVGGFYAAGMSPAEIRQALQNIDWHAAFADRPEREHLSFRRKQGDSEFLFRHVHVRRGRVNLPPGVIKGQRLGAMLKVHELLLDAAEDFDRLPVPFRAVAADLETGRKVTLSRGSLATALRASMSIPGVFPPVELDGRLLVDGGIVSNLPIETAREMGAEVIIAVDISTPLEGPAGRESFLKVVRRLTGFLTSRNVEREAATLGRADILIRPDLGDITVASFDRVLDAAAVGRVTAEAEASRLSALAVSEREFERLRQRQRRAPRPWPVVARVELRNRGPLGDPLLRAALSQPTGAPLEPDALLEDLAGLYGMDCFEPIRFDLHRRGGDADLILDVEERRTGLNTVALGLTLEEDFEGESNYTLTARHHRLAVNRRAGEWRNDLSIGDEAGARSEFYQPFDRRRRWFVAPSVFYDRRRRPLVVDGTTLADILISEYGARFDIGRALGNWGEIRAGAERAAADSEVRVGAPAPPESIDIFRVDLALRYDTRDDLSWPRSGGRGVIELVTSDEVLGGETNTSNLNIAADWAFSRGKNTFAPAVVAGIDLSGSGGVSEGFDLGGLFQLSGYRPSELTGAEGAVGRLVYYRQLGPGRSGLRPGWYVGASLEAGNVYQTGEPRTLDSVLFGASLFVGLDTLLGPVYVGVGVAEPGRDRFYVSVGRSFF